MLCKGTLCKGTLYKGTLCKGKLCKGTLYKGTLCKGTLYKGTLHKRLKIKIQMWCFMKQALKTDNVKFMGWLWGVYSGWDSLLLNYGGDVFLERRSLFYMINIIVLWKWWHSFGSSLQLHACVCVCVMDVTLKFNEIG